MKSSPLQHVMEVIGTTALILFIIFVANNPTTSAQSSQCPVTGTVPITTATRSDATAAGIPTNVNCWNPNNANAGLAAGSAKAYLEAHASKSANIECLNSQFAENLAKLMQSMPAGTQMTIISGYRTAAQQSAIYNSGTGATHANACQSYHNYGLAADFSTSASIMKQLRLTSSKFGLQPVSTYDITNGCTTSGFCDPYHIEMGGSLPPQNQCGVCATTGTSADGTLPNTPATTAALNQDIQADDQAPPPTETPTPTSETSADIGTGSGDVGSNTDNNAGTNAAGAAANTASGQCSLGLINIGGSCLPMSMLQSLLSPQQAAAVPPPPPAPATTPTTASNPSTPASETAALSSAPSLSSVASTPTTQSPLSSNLLQTTPSTSIVPATPITIPTITIPTLLTPTSTQSLLQQLENPPTLNIPASATVTPITLNNTSVVSELAPSNPPPSLQPSIEPLAQAQPSPSGQPSAQQGAPAQNGANLGAITVEQPSTQVTQSQPGGTTFESGNLGGSAPQTIAPAQNTFASDALSILQTLQGELIKALQFLKPFNSGSTQ